MDIEIANVTYLGEKVYSYIEETAEEYQCMLYIETHKGSNAIAKAKQNTKCRKCGRTGHWEGDDECPMKQKTSQQAVPQTLDEDARRPLATCEGSKVGPRASSEEDAKAMTKTNT